MLAAVVVVVLFACGANRVATAQTLPTADPADDPRPALGRFFDAIRRADKPAAMQCWNNDVEGDEHRKYVTKLVHHLLDEMIASHRLEQALAKRLPDAYRKASQAANTTPTEVDVAKARFTLYRRLAIVNWGHDEDSGLPMEFDSRPDQQRWKISMRQWYTTNRSSVGDSMLLSGWGAKAKELTAAEILADKIKTIEQLQEAYLRHMTEVAETGERKEHGSATAPGK